MTALAVAFQVRFVQDDAFISFRYARNLADGNGLVFNKGERVEGYTNFLWTVLFALPERFGWDTPNFAIWLGLVVFAPTLWLTYRLASRLTGSRTAGYLATVLTATNATFLGYATGGLETMLVALLVLASIELLHLADSTDSVRTRTFARVGAGAVGAFCAMVRLDSVVLIGTLWIFAVVSDWRRSPRGGRDAAATAVQLAVVPFVVLTPWFVWRYDFYGALLPNTFAAKQGDRRLEMTAFAVLYLAVFALWYGSFLLIPRLRDGWRGLIETPERRQVFALIPIWCCYIVAVGGDFMEFRFMVPIIPMLSIVAWLLIDPIRSRVRSVLLITTLLVFSVTHFAPTPLGYPVFTFHHLRAYPDESVAGTKALGMTIHDLFATPVEGAGGDDVILATGALGVVPYYATIETIDLVGLADRSVARDGIPMRRYIPGHTQTAKPAYLESRNVDLVTFASYWVTHDPQRRSYDLSDMIYDYPVVDLRDFSEPLHAVELPLDEHRRWLVLYVGTDPTVEALADAGVIDLYPVTDRCDASEVNQTLLTFWGTRTC